MNRRGEICIDITEPQVTEGNNTENGYFRNIQREEIGRMGESRKGRTLYFRAYFAWHKVKP